MAKTATGDFCVARSSLYYQDGINVVEIETNGFDSLSPGMLVEKYAGEGECFADPRDAVETAIRIRDAWIADGGEVAGITFGSTGGGMVEPEVFDGTDDDLREEACKRYESLPKCDKCGELRRETYHLVDDPDAGDFCSSYCAEEAEREYYVANNIDDWRVKATAELATTSKEYLFGMLQRRTARKLDRDKVMRRFTLGRLARVVASKLTDGEIEAWASE